MPQVPAVERTLKILDYLAEHPDQSFSLSQLASRLELPKATCLSILVLLVDTGLVQRDEEKFYSLGTRLLHYGGAAALAIPGFMAARKALWKVSIKTGLDGLVCTADEANITVLDTVGEPNIFGRVQRAGSRVPFEPPAGVIFMAWSDEDDVGKWLGRLQGKRTTEEVQRYRRSLEFVQSQGYSTGVESQINALVADLLSAIADGDGDPGPSALSILRELGLNLAQGGENSEDDPSFVIVPIFDRDGRVHLTLTLVTPTNAPSSRLMNSLPVLLNAAKDVTSQLGGVMPEATILLKGKGADRRSTAKAKPA